MALADNRITVGNPEGDLENVTLDSDGTGPANLAGDAAVDAKPAGSTDGRWFAFQNNRDGNAEISTMVAEGSGPTNRINDGARNFDRDWQPRERR